MVISCSYCYLCHVEKKTLNRKAGKRKSKQREQKNSINKTKSF